jgi:DNA-binding transcriptional LysR family regulator
MSKFERISTFISVIEQNGFAAAARKKGVSAAAISRQIAQLEAELNAQLISRTTRQMSLTDIGMEYYQQCKRVINELQEAENAIAKSKNEATGHLHVVANRYFATRYLLPRLPEFQAQNPNLYIHLELAERFPNFDKEEVDLLFGVTAEGPEELVRRRIATTRYILCASPRYLKKYGVPKTPSDLANHLYITHSMRKPENVILFKETTVHITPALWLNDSFAMRECAIQAMGLVDLHDYIVLDAIEEGKLVEVMREYQHPQQSVYLYYQQNRYLRPKIRRFIDFFA